MCVAAWKTRCALRSVGGTRTHSLATVRVVEEGEDDVVERVLRDFARPVRHARSYVASRQGDQDPAVKKAALVSVW